MKNINKKLAVVLAGAAIISGLALALPAFADTDSHATAPQGQWSGQGGQWQGRMGGTSETPGMTGMMRGTPPAAIGTVTAISGTTLTVTSHSFVRPASNGETPANPPASTATTTYTVDASNATVMKNNATSTVSAIAVGDIVIVQGTVNGTTITATTIRDGMMRGPGEMKGPGGTPGSGSGNAPSPIQGNGEPVVAGTISSISGSTLTVGTKSNVTYTVDATNAKIVQGNSAVSLSSVAVGDSVIIQGTVNGTAITASSVIDQKAPAATGTNEASPSHMGFFGSIGSFFSHLFGF